ncbi:MAG TPA: hypothetical protein VLM75_01365 [Spirochaetota bacterium]|nr:hypothetical protein [Spirochaetota bacterium]
MIPPKAHPMRVSRLSFRHGRHGGNMKVHENPIPDEIKVKVDEILKLTSKHFSSLKIESGSWARTTIGPTNQVSVILQIGPSSFFRTDIFKSLGILNDMKNEFIDHIESLRDEKIIWFDDEEIEKGGRIVVMKKRHAEYIISLYKVWTERGYISDLVNPRKEFAKWVLYRSRNGTIIKLTPKRLSKMYLEYFPKNDSDFIPQNLPEYDIVKQL